MHFNSRKTIPPGREQGAHRCTQTERLSRASNSGALGPLPTSLPQIRSGRGGRGRKPGLGPTLSCQPTPPQPSPSPAATSTQKASEERPPGNDAPSPDQVWPRPEAFSLLPLRNNRTQASALFRPKAPLCVTGSVSSGPCLSLRRPTQSVGAPGKQQEALGAQVPRREHAPTFPEAR